MLLRASFLSIAVGSFSEAACRHRIVIEVFRPGFRLLGHRVNSCRTFPVPWLPTNPKEAQPPAKHRSLIRSN